MDGNIVKLVFQTVSNGNGLTQFRGQLQATTVQAQKAISTARGLAGAFTSVGGAAGGALGAVSQFVGSFAQLGAIGGIIAGVQIAIDQLASHYMRVADEMVEKTGKMLERSKERLAKSTQALMKPVEDWMHDATTAAKDASAELNNLASSYLKVATARDRMEKSARGAKASALELEKSQKMSAAGSDGERAMIAATYDARIARAGLESTRDEQGRSVRQAGDNLYIAQAELRNARIRERASNKAYDVAEEKYDITHYEDGTGKFEGADAFRRKLEESARNLQEATRDRIAKEAAVTAAELELKRARNEQTSAVNLAKKGVVEADAAQRRLAKAQAEAEKAERAKARADREAAERASRQESLQKAYEASRGRGAELASASQAYASQFERAFDLWRDPEAAKAAQDEAIRRDEDMKKFRRAVGGYFGKDKIDEAARLMREGDTESLEARMSDWRRSSMSFTPQAEQLVRAAAAEKNKSEADRAIIDIEKNTHDLAMKLDELLSMK